MLKRIIVLLGAIVLFPSGSFSWGREGHRIVARIAARNLMPTTRLKLAAILGTNDAGLETAMADAAVWWERRGRGATTDTRRHPAFKHLESDLCRERLPSQPGRPRMKALIIRISQSRCPAWRPDAQPRMNGSL
jgi:hypothetical protein